MFTVVGDPHCKNSNLDKINRLFDIVEFKGKDVIWLGDFLDTKEVIRGNCLNLIIKRLEESKLHHIILVGNHDYFNLDCEAHSLEALKLLGNVSIIESLEDIGDNMYALPYIHDRVKLKEELAKIPDDAVVFGHFEVTGFDFGNGHICEEGISYEDFSRFKRVISGHFHKFQSEGNFVYLGTPFSHSFGESNQDKYIGDYRVDGAALLLEPTEFPRHITTEISSVEELNEGYLNSTSDYIRIINTNPDTKIDKSKYPNVKFIDRFNVKKEKKTFVVSDTDSNEAKFQKWGKDIKKLPKETIQLGLDILRGINESAKA